MELKKLVQEYLQDAKMMHLATVSNGRPWVCNVWFAADEGMNMYWFSAITRRHSKEVAQDGHVAGSMCLEQTPEDKPQGLQFEGTAKLLTDPADVKKAMSVYVDRIFPQKQVDQFMAHPDRPHKFYKITPTAFVLFDVVNFPDDPRQEYIPGHD